MRKLLLLLALVALPLLSQQQYSFDNIKAPHTHTESDVVNLTTDLAAKASVAAMANKANTSHTHPQSDVTNLVSDLAGKAASAHTHTGANITSAVALANSLAADPANCPGGQAAAGVSATGAAEGCFAPEGGSGATMLRVANNVSSTDNTNWATITGLSWATLGSTNYAFDCRLYYTTATSTTALQLSTSGPGAFTALRYAVETSTTATARHNASQNAHITVTNPATGGGATALPVQMHGMFQAGGLPGTMNIVLRSEISASAVTVLAGSNCSVSVVP